MPTILALSLASALGGLARYLLGGVIARRGGAFPWETLIVNVSGAFALGLLVTLFTESGAVPPWARSAILIGFLGSYTTFSTWSLESFRLIEEGAHLLAFANLVGSLLLGLVAVYGGIVLGRAVS